VAHQGTRRIHKHSVGNGGRWASRHRGQAGRRRPGGQPMADRQRGLWIVMWTERWTSTG